MFAAIDISSIIIFNSDKVNFNCVLFWSDIGSTKSSDSLGIDKAVCIICNTVNVDGSNTSWSY